MSNSSTPHSSYYLDQQGRLVESENAQPNTRRLPSLEEAFRRISSSLGRQDDNLTLDSTFGKFVYFYILLTMYCDNYYYFR